MIALSIFLTYALQFYVPMEIIWKNIKGNFNEHLNVIEYSVRTGLVVWRQLIAVVDFDFNRLTYFQILTVIIAIIIPNLGPFITLIGAVCLSTLGLMFPAIIETITYWERPGMGRFNWRLIKNVLLVIFGIIGLLTGTYVSIEEITETFIN